MEDNRMKKKKKKKKLKKEATKAMIFLITELFRVSKKEIPIRKIRLIKSYCPNLTECSVAFSRESNEYYYLDSADRVWFATSEKLLRCDDKKIRDVPKTCDRMIYFKNTMFSEEILDWVYEKMHDMSEYQVRKFGQGIEIIL